MGLVTFPTPTVTAIQNISRRSTDFVRVIRSSSGHKYVHRFRSGGYFEGRISFVPIGVSDAEVLAATRLEAFFEDMNDVSISDIPHSELDLTKIGVGSEVDPMGNPVTISNDNRIIPDAGIDGYMITDTPGTTDGRNRYTVDQDVPLAGNAKYANVLNGRLVYVKRINARTIEVRPDYKLAVGTMFSEATTLRFELTDYNISRQTLIVHDQTQVQQNIFLDFVEPSI